MTTFFSPGAAWRWAVHEIKTRGQKVTDENGAKTKELRNLVLTVTDPSVGWPIDSSGWDIPALEVYAKTEMLSDENRTGFEYTYGERLAPDFDYISRLLTKNPTSRRAILVTWWDEDLNSNDPPCLIVLEFLVRDGKLHMTAFFRSHDIERAWPANVYGLHAIQKHIAAKLPGVEPGEITTVSASAHVYEV